MPNLRGASPVGRDWGAVCTWHGRAADESRVDVT